MEKPWNKDRFQLPDTDEDTHPCGNCQDPIFDHEMRKCSICDVEGCTRCITDLECDECYESD